MPSLQKYSAQISGGLPANIRASSESFGGNTTGLQAMAQANERAARELGAASEEIGKIIREREEVEYHRSLSEFRLETMQRAQQLNQADLESDTELVNAYNQDTEAQKNGVGLLQYAYMRDFKERSGQLNVPRSQQSRASVDLGNMEVSFIGSAIEEQARRTGIQQKENWEASLTANQNAVFLNPSLAESVLEETKRAAGSLSVDSATRQVFINDAEQAIRGAAAQSVINSNPAAFIASAKAGKYNNLDKLPQFMKQAQNELERRGAGVRDQIRTEAAEIEQAANMGLSVPREKIEKLAARADSNGMEKQGDALRKFADVQDSVVEFAPKPLKEQAEELKSKRVVLESGDLGKIEEYTALSKVYDTKIRMLQSDPWEFYSAHNITKRPEPIQNLSDAGEISAALTQRKADIARIKEMEGFTLPLLTKPEINQIKDIYENGKPEESAAVVASLGSVLNQDELRAVAQSVAKDAPMMAVAMSLDRDGATAVLEGDKAKGEVTSAKVRESVNNKIGGMVFDTEALEGIQSALYAAYKKLSNDDGDTSKDVNDKRLDKAIEMVIGKPVDIKPRFLSPSSSVFTYKDETGQYISDNKLENIFDKMDNSMLSTLYGELPYASDGNPVSAEDILRHGSYVSAGDGLYLIRMKGLGDLFRRDGRPYVLDARKMDAYERP